MADTGCQSRLCGLPVMNKLGISEKNLIPVTMRMHAANKAPIKILGAAIIRLSGIAKSGKRVETDKSSMSQIMQINFSSATKHASPWA